MNRAKLERQARQQMTKAHHEAGHAVAAFHVGIEIRDISIVGENREVEHIEHLPYFSNLEIGDMPEHRVGGERQLNLENSAFISLVGPWAQKKFNPKGFRKGQVEGDYIQAIKFLSHVRNDQEVLEHYFKVIDIEARNFVQDRFKWSVIHHLALVLLDQGIMTGDNIRDSIISGFRPHNNS